jgi:hypothetical protein
MYFKESPMKRVLAALPVMALAATVSGTAFAQSSGNFAASLNTQQCTLSSSNGSLSGGMAGHLLTTSIQTPNSNQTTLLITPSFVTGLYSNTYITSTQSTANQTAEVIVSVLLDGKPVAPETTATPSVTYDARFQQISTQMWTQIAECQMNQKCDFSMVLSTLDAHSFDFVVPNVGGGSHNLDVSWAMACDNGSGSPSPSKCSTTFANNSAAACVGPGVITVQQVKAFSQSGGVVIQ